MANESPPAFEQNATYGAEQSRRAINFMLQRGSSVGSVAGGLVSASDCQVTPPGSGMSCSVASGEVIVSGSSSAAHIRLLLPGQLADSLTIAASSPSLPRIDTIIGQVTDSAYSGSTNTFAPAVITGTATAGATLANLSGAGSVPASSIVLAYVLVPAAATNIVGADISNVAGLVCDSLPSFAYINGSGATTAVSGQWIEAAAGVTVTLPAPIKNSTVAITAASGVSGSNQVTVAAGSSGAIYGLGLSAASSFKLGTVGASVILEADGSNWYIGQWAAGHGVDRPYAHKLLGQRGRRFYGSGLQEGRRVGATSRLYQDGDRRDNRLHASGWLCTLGGDLPSMRTCGHTR